MADDGGLFWSLLLMYLAGGMLITIGLEIYRNRDNKGKKRLFVLFGAAITLDTFLFPTLLNSITGNALTLAQSDAIDEVDNFMGPMGSVFLFLEDGLTVRIAASIGGQRFAEAGALMKMALYAGLGSGLVCAAVAIPTAYVQPIFEFFVPYREGAKLPGDCPAVATGGLSIAALQAEARPYWVLTALGLPFAFALKCSVAFFLGSQEFMAWIIAGIVAYGTSVALTFLFLDTFGWGAWGTAVVGLIESPLFVAVTVWFMLKPENRKRLHLVALKIEREHWPLLKRSAVDGLRLMVKDLLGTIQGNLPSMLAAQLSLQQQYSLHLLGSVSSSLSVFSVFLGYVGRLRGARFLGEGSHVAFRHLVQLILTQGAVVGLLAAVAASAGHGVMPKHFASSSLEQLKDGNCTSGRTMYDQVFDVADGPSYWIMALNLLVAPLSTVYGALLYAFRDFRFVMRVGIVNFVLSIAGMLIAYLSVHDAGPPCRGCTDIKLFAITFASSLPGYVVLLLYAARMHFRLLRRLPLEDTDSEVIILKDEINSGVANVPDAESVTAGGGEGGEDGEARRGLLGATTAGEASASAPMLGGDASEGYGGEDFGDGEGGEGGGGDRAGLQRQVTLSAVEARLNAFISDGIDGPQGVRRRAATLSSGALHGDGGGM